ncbi:DUF4192 domain-containing protein [Actinomycetes bacterium KLBMP 9797]
MTDHDHTHEFDDVTEPLVLVAESTVDLLAVVPHLFGFAPRDLVVLLGTADGQLVYASHTNLPPAGFPARALRFLVREMARSAARDGAQQLILIGYGTAERVTPVLRAAKRVLARGPMDVADLLRVTGERYFSHLSPGPSEGVPFDLAASGIHAAVAGHARGADNAEMDRVAAVTGPALEAVRHATEAAVARLGALVSDQGVAAARRAGMRAVWDALDRYRDGDRLDDDELAWLSLHLFDADVRVVAWHDTDDEAWQERLWLDVTRRAQPDLVGPPASLLAFAAWRRGNTALAKAAVRRALEADPDDGTAQTIGLMLVLGMPPSVLDWPPAPAADGMPERSDGPDPA